MAAANKTAPPDPAPPKDPNALTGPTPPAISNLPPLESRGPRVDAAKAETRRVLAIKAKPPSIKVEATREGYYDEKFRRVGDVFLIKDMEEFSETWMVLADRETTERQATAADDAARRADRSGVARAAHAPTDDTDNPLDA